MLSLKTRLICDLHGLWSFCQILYSFAPEQPLSVIVTKAFLDSFVKFSYKQPFQGDEFYFGRISDFSSYESTLLQQVFQAEHILLSKRSH